MAYRMHQPITIGLLIFFASSDSVRLRLQSTYLVELILFLFFLRVPLAEMARKFDWKLARASLKLGLPVMISAIFGIIINFGDKYFLEKYTDGFTDLSYYYLAFACASAIPLIFASLQNAWIPLFLKEKDLRVNIAKTNKLMIRVAGGFLLLSIAIIIFFKLLLCSVLSMQSIMRAFTYCLLCWLAKSCLCWLLYIPIT